MPPALSKAERRLACTLLVASAVGLIWHSVADLRPPPVPVRLVRGALVADSTATWESTPDPIDPFPIDLRRAGVDTLMMLPGIGPVLAERIEAWRLTRQQEWLLEDLLQVRGIGPVLLERIRPLVHLP